MTKANLIATAPLSEVKVTRWKDGKVLDAQDNVAEEVPIAIIYNGISHAVMLATPQDLEDFALGFSLSEGILQNKNELYDIEIETQANGIELKMEVASAAFAKLKQRRRNLTGRTGCGLCGAESLQDALRLDLLENSDREENHVQLAGIPAHTKASSQCSVKASSIQAAFHAMQKQQVLQQATGATHACAWVDASGEVQLVREDVGRHNAMDKLIGALAKLKNESTLPKNTDGFVLTSSRASVEMVQKVALSGYNILVAISAPTGLAIRVAQQFDVTLVGFLRDYQFVIYTNSARIQI